MGVYDLLNNLSLLRKLDPIFMHPIVSIHEFLKPYEQLCSIHGNNMYLLLKFTFLFKFQGCNPL